MDGDTISRQAAIDALIELTIQRDKWDDKEGFAQKRGIDAAICAIEDLPSAERRGRWIEKYRGNYLCSVCGAWYRTTDDYGNIIDGEMTANYCESCGAKMDEVETNETCTSRRSE